MGGFEKEKDEYLRVISEHFSEYQRKMKQWCFKSHTDYSDDIFSETVLKTAELISRKGLNDLSEQGCLNYFFIAFKLNTYQGHLQEDKHRDMNLSIDGVDVEDTEYSDDDHIYNDFVRAFISKTVKDRFSSLEYAIYRLRYLIVIDGHSLNYKQIKQITGVTNSRAILIKINKYLRENITRDLIKSEFENNFNAYF